LRLGA